MGSEICGMFQLKKHVVFQPTVALLDRTGFSPEINGAPRAGVALGAIVEVSLEVELYLFLRLYSSFFFNYEILFCNECKNSLPGVGLHTKVKNRCKNCLK